MSIEVPLDELGDEIGRWDFCYLVTVSDGERPHLLALHPELVGTPGELLLRFDAGGGRACRNAAARPDVTLVFPPVPHSEGMSLVVDGTATVSGSVVDVVPARAVRHRPAP